MVKKINAAQFEAEAKKSAVAVVDFSATWCGPCRMVSPLVDELAEENSEFTVGKVNVDDQPELAAAFGVSSIPMLAVMKNGAVTAHAVGARPKSAILDILKG